MTMTTTITKVVLLAAVTSNLVRAQAPPTILTIDLASFVEYQADVYDASKYGKNSDITPSAGAGKFGVVTLLGDIVAVNGQPAKGIYVGRTRVIGAAPTPSPGSAIADIAVTALREHVFEILQPDRTLIGTIMSI